uniref:Uncharacterized protein n=1 Tax=Ciona savignyi TaxID=51511 RepID=H2ZQF5_CIOSA
MVLAVYNSLNEPQEAILITPVEDETVTSHDTPLVGKKHGLLCTVLTKLHLKKLHNDPDNSSSGKKRRKFLWKKSPSKRENDATSEYNERDRLLGKSKESLVAADEYLYRGKRVDFAVLPEKYDLLEESNCDIISVLNDSGIHDESFCSSDDDVADDVHLTDVVKRRSFGAYVSKKWHAKRLKRARKAIRRTTRHVIKGLQTGVHSPFGFMDASSVLTAVNKNNRR